LSKLVLYTLGFDQSLREEISSNLADDRHFVKHFDYDQKAYQEIIQNRENIDCLIFFQNVQNNDSAVLIVPLIDEGVLLPSLIFHLDPPTLPPETQIYHSAEIYINPEQLSSISTTVDQAIAQFLNLAPSCLLSDKPVNIDKDNNRQTFLLLQQRRLAEKLKERLGYLGVYYKRNPKYFYRNLSPEEQQNFRTQFAADYREIILDYFNENPPSNQAIDQFVNQAFFADISVSYILETHMKLMDAFTQQLKLEGRSEEILLDYRLTLIDIVAHLCEMYRRSIPREDLPFELLFRTD
jgi:circadian clock protein KaiA